MSLDTGRETRLVLQSTCPLTSPGIQSEGQDVNSAAVRIVINADNEVNSGYDANHLCCQLFAELSEMFLCCGPLCFVGALGVVGVLLFTGRRDHPLSGTQLGVRGVGDIRCRRQTRLSHQINSYMLDANTIDSLGARDGA